MEKLLTVIVPAYNVERYLDQCLTSFVECPARDDLEVIVVDDGATDGSLALAQRYRFQHPDLFRVFHKDNGGHGSVINFGVEQARGRYLKVVDGDDWVDGEALAGLIGFLRRTDADLVASDYNCIEDGTYRLIERRHAARDAGHYGRSLGFDVAATEEVMKIHSLTIRTALLRENGIRLTENCFYEDAEYALLPIPFCETVAYDDHCVYQYRLGRAGQSVDIQSLTARRGEHLRAEYALLPIPFCETVAYDDHCVYQYRLGRAGQSVDIQSLTARRGEHLRILESLFALSDRCADADAGHRAYLDRGIALFVQNQYQIYLALGFKEGAFAEMRAFDRRLRAEQPGVYGAVWKKSIWVIRKTCYAAYPLGVAAYRAVAALRAARGR